MWDDPCPPAVVPDSRHVVARPGNRVLADRHTPIRALETISPPAFDLPHGDVDFTLLRPDAGHTFCEWKDQADYFRIELDDRASRASSGAIPSRSTALANSPV